MPLLHLFLPLLPIPTHCTPTTSFNPWPHHVSAQVNAEDGHGAQRQGDVGDDEQQERGDLMDVAGQGVGDGFLQVVKDQAACGEVLRASGRPEGPSPPLAPESLAARLLYWILYWSQIRRWMPETLS